MPKLEAEKKLEEAGFVWSMNTNLGDGKMMQVTGNFLKGMSPQEMSKEVDKVSLVFQIQRLKQLEIPTTVRELEAQAQAADKYTDDLEKLVEDNRDKAKIPSNVRAIMDNTRENIRVMGERIDMGKAHLERLQAQLKELEGE